MEKDGSGNFICYLKTDTSKSTQSKAQLEQFKNEQASAQMGEPDCPMTKAMIEAMRDFKIEFYVTMPNEITEITGVFKKKDAKTAYMEFSGDLFTSPELLDQMYGVSMDTVPSVTCSAGDLSFDIVDYEEASYEWSAEDSSFTEQFPPVMEEKKSKLTLNNGRVFEGDIVEQNERHVKIKVRSGIVLTYPREEISSIE
jgi:hypothetical protein